MRREAMAAMRAKAWDAVGLTEGDEPLELDLDASLVEIHSEHKEGTAPTCKRVSGSRPVHNSDDAAQPATRHHERPDPTSAHRPGGPDREEAVTQPPRTIPTLIVDDDDDMRLLISVLIRRANQGLTVGGTASSGAEALGSIETLNPAVVVMDYRMPNMNGLQTAASIRASRPDQPIVLCSAFLDDELEAAAAALDIRCVLKTDLHRLPDEIRAAAA